MKKSTKIWLWVALIICIATTIMNASMGRTVSAVIAVVAIAGLCVLLFTQRKFGFTLMCVCYAISCIYSIMGSLGGPNVLVSVIMSVVGSLLIPGITALFLRGQWKSLK